MTQPAKVQEPSMEEILASIRRIIADDEAKPPESASVSGVTGATSLPQLAKEEATSRPLLAAVRLQPSSEKSAHVGSAESVPMPAQLDERSSEISADRSDIFELTDEMALPEAGRSSFRKVEPENDVEFAEPAPAAARYEPKPKNQPGVGPQDAADILSQSTVSAVESAFNSLAATVLSNNARTLEDLVKEMMRPMLKNWLDDNLPGLVERIVKAEIERVSRGR